MSRLGLVCGALMLSCAGSPPAPAPAPPPAPPPPAAAPEDSWRAERPAPGAPGRIDYPQPEITRFDNGFTLIVVPRPAAVVHLSIVSRDGASSLPAGKSGLAALTARMLAEGTRKKSSLALAEATESLGAVLSTDAGRDELSLTLELSTSDVDAGLTLLAEIVEEPAFRQIDFERVRAEWLDGLIAERQNPSRLASLAGLRRLLGPELGAPVGGSVPDVQRLTVADLKSFHQRAFAPSKLALVLCGGVSTSDVVDLVHERFGKRSARPAATSPQRVSKAPAAAPGGDISIIDRPGSVQTALFVAQRFPDRHAPGHEARRVLNNLAGGLFTSRINQNLRERHAFTYGARSTLAATRGWGAFIVATSVRTEVTAEALEQLLLELAALADPGLNRPIAPAELARSKADLTHSLGAHLEHVSRVAADMRELFVHDLPPGYFTSFPRAIAQIDAPQVQAEAGRIDPDGSIIVAVGDRARIEAALSKLERPFGAAPAALLE